MKREFTILLIGWIGLTTILFGLGRQNLAVPGLYYDEAVFAGMTKDFLDGKMPGHHMPGAATTPLLHGPFPVFVQPYLGALKCWWLIPIFKIFGSTMTVLRAANIFFCASALLFFMLWAWRLIGLSEALIAAILLTLDPAFFFSSVLDWGSVLPSLICRFAGFFLVLLMWRNQKTGWAILAGVVLGLGFFNKIDFGVLLIATTAAAAIAYGPLFKKFIVEQRLLILLMALGFTVGGGLMLLRLPFIFISIFSGDAASSSGEMSEKLQTLHSMYDGSYFYRLMAAGGRFDQLQNVSPPVWTPLGILFLAAIFILLADVIFFQKGNTGRRTKIFLLLSALMVTLGILILPGAVRIHHTTLVYPLPHLIIAVAALIGWKHPWKTFLSKSSARILVVITLTSLATCAFYTDVRTQKLIRETGGSGWWSDALVKFAGQIQNQSQLVVTSLDWGFNEQLEFLTDGPRLKESFRQTLDGEPQFSRDANQLYLVHPAAFSLYPLGVQFMEALSHETNDVVIHPWRDLQGHIAFYTIQFGKP